MKHEKIQQALDRGDIHADDVGGGYVACGCKATKKEGIVLSEAIEPSASLLLVPSSELSDEAV